LKKHEDKMWLEGSKHYELWTKGETVCYKTKIFSLASDRHGILTKFKECNEDSYVPAPHP